MPESLQSLFTGIDRRTLLMGAVAASGCAVALFTWFVCGYLSRPRAGKDDLDVFEFQRRERLRQSNRVYRWFEPAIDDLAGEIGNGSHEALAKFRRDLGLAGVTAPWKPEEYLASKYVEAVFIALASFAILFGLTSDWPTALVVAVVCGFGFVPMTRKSIQKKSRLRIEVIRHRLPFVLDLTSLTMEAGATFLESLQTVVQENKGHPLGDQLAEVLRDISVGRTRRESLEALQARLADDDVSEIVFAIVKGEELGTPLGQILRNQAEQMRLKRSQWAEKAAAEAQVNIVFPGLLVMIACMLVVVAPFVLGAVFSTK